MLDNPFKFVFVVVLSLLAGNSFICAPPNPKRGIISYIVHFFINPECTLFFTKISILLLNYQLRIKNYIKKRLFLQTHTTGVYNKKCDTTMQVKYTYRDAYV